MTLKKLARTGSRLAATACSWTMANLLGRRDSIRITEAILTRLAYYEDNRLGSNGESAVCHAITTRHRGSRATVFDVGANVGDWAQMLLDAAHARCHVDLHLFEPASTSYAALASLRPSGESSLMLNNIAMGAHSGQAILYTVSPTGGQNSLVASAAKRAAIGTESILMSTLDRYCDEKAIDCIHLLKIDAEGSDMNVIRGARSLLARKAIDVVQFEYNHCWIDARRYLRDAFEFLQPLGYCVGRLSSRGIIPYNSWSPALENFREANWLAWSSPHPLNIPCLNC